MLCPNCGSALSAGDGKRFFAPLSGLWIELLSWAALALILGLLWSSEAGGALRIALGVLALAIWFGIRWRRHVASREPPPPTERRFHCANCQRRFERNGEALRELKIKSS